MNWAGHAMKYLTLNIRRKTSERRRSSLLLLILGLILLAVGTSMLYVKHLLSPMDAPDQTRQVTVVIPPQTTSDGIGSILHRTGLIRQPKLFTYYSVFKGVDGRLKAGQYTISSGQSLPEMVQIMEKGPVEKIKFTIPEGYNTRQVAELLERQGLVDKERFYHEISAGKFPYEFIEKLPEGQRRLEGYLFPDTYHIGSNTPERAIIDMMLKRFDVQLKNMDYLNKVQKHGLTLHKAVTMASLIEREAKVDSERPLIAGVIYNRLRLGMPLQIDATVEYALGSHRSKIYYKDLEIDSPYNTYKIKGLPPGPIASPGEASLLAVVNPARTDYLYYVAKSDGSHAFARTLSEHNANKAKYLR